MNNQKKKISFAGVLIDPLDMVETIDWIIDAAQKDSFQYVVTPNAAHIVKIVEEPEKIAHLYKDAGICINDSRVIKKISKIQGQDLPVCPGSDLTVNLLDRLNKSPIGKIAVVGSEEEHMATLKAKYPNLDIEQYIPPMGFIKKPEEIAKAVDFIKNSNAKVYFLAVGMPQQEILAWNCAQDKSISGVGLCIGASIDFIVGTQTRAPEYIQKMGLEWLHRLLSSPQRMARRYLIESPRVFYYAYKYKDPANR